MSKITLADWKEKNFPGKVPSLRTCQNWANEGRIPGAMKMGGLWFVDTAIERKAAGSSSRVAKILAA